MQKSIRDKYLALRGLIEKGWCQGSYATDIDNNIIDYYSDKAVKFCLYGGMKRCGIIDDSSFLYKVLERRYPSCFGCMDFNDDRKTTKQDVIGLIDDAIALIPISEQS